MSPPDPLVRHTLGGYREYDPPPPLARFAEALRVHRAPDELPPGDGAMHRVLPDPALSLAFYCRRQPDGVPVEPKLIVIGPKTRPHIFAFRGGHEIAAVRVKLEWSAPLLELVPADHDDAEDDLAQVLPRLAGTLLDSLAGTRSAGEAAGRLAETIARRAGGMSARGPEVSSLLGQAARASSGRNGTVGHQRGSLPGPPLLVTQLSSP